MRRAVGILALFAILALPLSAPVGAQSAPKGYLIGSAAPLTQAQIAALQRAGAQVRHVYRNSGGAAAVISDQSLAAVRTLPFVTSVSEDTAKQIDAVWPAWAPSATSALPGMPYWLDLVDAEKATTFDGSGVLVAVLDTGFYPNWRDYFDESSIRTDLAKAFIAANGNENDNQWDVGSDPHGMATAATIVGFWLKDKPGEGGFGQGYMTGSAGTYWVPGAAPGAKVIPIKVCEPLGCWTSAIIAGIDYVTSLKKANSSQPIVINESLGGSALDPVEKAAIDAAVRAGVVLVASAGNEGDLGMGFPAAYEPVISVGAGGWTKQWAHWPDNTWWLKDEPEDGVADVYVTGFSSREKPGQYLDVVSTGRYLPLPYPCAQLYKDGQVTSGTMHRTCASKATPDSAQAAPYQYLFMSGTSFSAPTVAGIVARMLQKNPTLSNADAGFGTLGDSSSWEPGSLEKALEGSAVPIQPGSATITHRDGREITETWGTDATGHGWVFVDKAVAAVSTTSAPNGRKK